jgi:F-type H+-transporting ATPase subunit a
VLKRLFTPRNLAILLLIVALFVVSYVVGLLKMPAPFVSLAAEPVLHFGSFAVTNSLLTTWLVMLVLILISWLATRHIPSDLDKASDADLTPSGLQNVMEMVVEFITNLSKEIGGHWAPRFFPIAATLFLFVLVSNWSGLIPGVGSIGWLEHPHDPTTQGYIANGPILTPEKATLLPAGEETGEATEASGEGHGEGYIVVPWFRAPSTDLNFTLALALVVVGLTQYFGIRALGPGYFTKFVDFSGFKEGIMNGVIALFVGVLELISEFAKIISLAFRLFGNIFAGEILLVVIAFLIPYVVSLPFYGLEVFVGFMQAFVFLMLALVFFNLATIGHGGEEHH